MIGLREYARDVPIQRQMSMIAYTAVAHASLIFSRIIDPTEANRVPFIAQTVCDKVINSISNCLVSK